MSESTAAKNKAIVVEAFKTLFNKRGSGTALVAEFTFSMALISHQVAGVFSILLRASRQR
jgi:hypothetical protein